MKQFFKTHWFWLVFITIGIIAFYSWLGEHDARLQADAQVKQSEDQVTVLRQQIQQNTDQIATLQRSIDDVNKAAQRKIDVIVKQQEQVKTPEQAIPAVTQTNPELDARSLPDAFDRASVKALPLFTTLSQCRITDTKLDACTTNLASETEIAKTNDANYQQQIKITAEKDKEISALKQPKSFWRRFGSTVKTVGISVGAGYLLGHKF